jgi:hypothetical protein
MQPEPKGELQEKTRADEWLLLSNRYKIRVGGFDIIQATWFFEIK